MSDPHGWTDRDGILWRSKDSEVIVSSSYMIKDEHYRIVVNDEELMEEQLVLNSLGGDWEKIVMDAIKFAEGYSIGKKS